MTYMMMMMMMTAKSSLLHLIELCLFCRSYMAIYEKRYRKVLSQKLKEHLPTDVSIPKKKVDLEGKPLPFFVGVGWRGRGVNI